MIQSNNKQAKLSKENVTPIFIVSLKKDIERREKITHALSIQNLPWTMVDAIEGKTYSLIISIL